MRVLIIDVASNALDWALRCIDAGHDVVFYDKPRPNGEPRLAGKGMLKKLVDYDALRSKWIDWSDLIFLPDNTHYLEMLEPFRQRGYPIFGCCLEAAQWELNRGVGQEVMKKAGLNVLGGVTFHDHESAARFVEKNPTYLVSKPSGDADKAMSYVAHDAASLIHMLMDRWKKNEKYVKDARAHGFILQEKVEGVEMAIGGWFGPGGWSRHFHLNAEYKKLCNGDLGCNTGEMGTLSKYVTKEEKLVKVAMMPLTKHLQAIDYVGYVDINGMIDAEGEYWPFEFTMRPPWPGMHNMVALHEGDPARWMLDLILGRDTLQVKDECCVSVVLALHPFPSDDPTDAKHVGTPVYNAGDRDHIHLSDVMLGEDVPVQVGEHVLRLSHPVACGGYVAVVTGCGKTITGARQSAYAAIKKVKIPANPLYRTDIGRGRLIEGLPTIQALGYAKAFKVV